MDILPGTHWNYLNMNNSRHFPTVCYAMTLGRSEMSNTIVGHVHYCVPWIVQRDGYHVWASITWKHLHTILDLLRRYAVSTLSVIAECILRRPSNHLQILKELSSMAWKLLPMSSPLLDVVIHLQYPFTHRYILTPVLTKYPGTNNVHT